MHWQAGLERMGLITVIVAKAELHALKNGYETSQYLTELIRTSNTCFRHLISICSSVTSYHLYKRLESPRCWNWTLFCVLCCIFFVISSSGCHSADRYRLTCKPRSHKHTQTHLSRGLSPAGGGLLPNLQAGRLPVFIFITHTLIGTDRTHTRTHTHTQLGKNIY